MRSSTVLARTTILLVFALALSACGDPDVSEAPGLSSNGSLAPCPSSPNCVNSEYPDDEDHYIAPIAIRGNPLTVWQRLQDSVVATGGNIVEKEDFYIAATYTSDLMKYVDDLELRVDVLGRVVHVRSASRVGYGDGGANAKRVEALRTAFSR